VLRNESGNFACQGLPVTLQTMIRADQFGQSLQIISLDLNSQGSARRQRPNQCKYYQSAIVRNKIMVELMI
jgi:hypothetical protein